LFFAGLVGLCPRQTKKRAMHCVVWLGKTPFSVTNHGDLSLKLVASQT
jgi:hypothetical protein